MSCIICNKDLSELPTTVVKTKGLQKLLQCSLIREDNLSTIFKDLENITLHIKCRLLYTSQKIGKDGQIKLVSMNKTKPKKLEQISVFEGTPTDFLPEPLETFGPEANVVVNTETDVIKTEAEEMPEEDDPSKPFPFQYKCLFCAKEYDEERERKKNVAKRNTISNVTHEHTQNKFIEYLKKSSRPGCDKVLRRIEGVDLIAARAFYHRKCANNHMCHNIKSNKISLSDKVMLQEAIKVTNNSARDLNEEDDTRITRNKSKRLTTSFDYEIEDYRCDEEEEHGKSIFYCHVCLSSDRNLDVLGEYEDVYNKICADITPQEDSNLCLVCWECKALLRNVQRFRQRVRTAQESFESCLTEHWSFRSMTTLGTNFPTNLISLEHDENKMEYETEVPPEPVVKTNYKGQNNVESHEVNYGFDDDDDDYISDAFKASNDDTFKKLNDDKKNLNDNKLEKVHDDKLKKLNENRFKKNNDDKNNSNDDKLKKVNDNTFKNLNDDKFKKLNDDTNNLNDNILEKVNNDKLNKLSDDRFKKSEDNGFNDSDDYDSEDIDVDDKNDEDFTLEPIKKKKPSDNSEPKKKPPFNSHEVILRERIETKDLEYWLEKERSSSYYKNLTNKCEKCISVIPEGTSHERHYHSPTNPYICPVCSQTFLNESAHSSHVASHYYILNCSVCWYKCYSKHHMKHHLDQHRSEVWMQENKDSNDDSDRYYICDHCKNKFSDKIHIASHVQRYHTPHKCPVCNKFFKRYLQLRAHKIRKHFIDRCEAAYCVPCDKQFDNVFLYKQHIENSKQHRHERKRPYVKPKRKPEEKVKCPECPNTYGRRYSLRCHMDLVHAKKTNFICQYCSKTFTRNGGLTSHIRRTHEGFRYPKNKFCDYCGQGFSTLRVLVHHIRTHTGERPHQCPHCDAKFAQKTAMNTHIKNRHLKKRAALPHSLPVFETPLLEIHSLTSRISLGHRIA